MIIILYKNKTLKQGARNDLWEQDFLAMIDTTRKTKATSFFIVGQDQRVPLWKPIDKVGKGSILYVSNDLEVYLDGPYINDVKDVNSGECRLLYNVETRSFFNGKTWNKITHERKGIKKQDRTKEV